MMIMGRKDNFQTNKRITPCYPQQQDQQQDHFLTPCSPQRLTVFSTAFPIWDTQTTTGAGWRWSSNTSLPSVCLRPTTGIHASTKESRKNTSWNPSLFPGCPFGKLFFKNTWFFGFFAAFLLEIHQNEYLSTELRKSEFMTKSTFSIPASMKG